MSCAARCGERAGKPEGRSPAIPLPDSQTHKKQETSFHPIQLIDRHSWEGAQLQQTGLSQKVSGSLRGSFWKGAPLHCDPTPSLCLTYSFQQGKACCCCRRYQCVDQTPFTRIFCASPSGSLSHVFFVPHLQAPRHSAHRCCRHYRRAGRLLSSVSTDFSSLVCLTTHPHFLLLPVHTSPSASETERAAAASTAAVLAASSALCVTAACCRLLACCRRMRCRCAAAARRAMPARSEHKQ